MMLASKPKVTVDVVSDIVCPWCWVGKRNLEEAVRRLPADEAAPIVRWHPYQLRPQAPREGAPKPPATPDNPRVGARLAAAGRAVGIDFTGKTDRTPNTLSAHTLMDFAAKAGGPAVQNALQEVLFRQYFTDGVFPEGAGLLAAAEEVGLDARAAMEHVEDVANRSKVAREAQHFAREGLSGVPSFFVNGRFCFSGAQPPEAFLEAFSLAPEELPER